MSVTSKSRRKVCLPAGRVTLTFPPPARSTRLVGGATVLAAFLGLAAMGAIPPGPALAREGQTFQVDFSTWVDPPLVKTKFGIYQPPLIKLSSLLKSTARLQEIGVQDFRYELGWGKPESLAFDQIAGTASDPTIDFTAVDRIVAALSRQGVKPLLVLGYCPNPLKTRSEWAGWKDPPGGGKVWQQIVERYADHLRTARGLRGVAYEIWNEPDISDASGKMFFTGGPSAYERLYARAAAGVRRGDGDALVGGPGLAFGWSIGYLKPILKQPIDFASIHGYDNYVAQIEAMRAALRDRPEVPIFLTEYGSFTAPVQAADRHPAAMRFFKDVKGLLTFTDTPKVYWAQWVDDLGSLMTRDGHRKALFNAFKVYGMMPVDRNAVRPDGSPGVNLLASSDDHNAAAVLWNESAGDRRVTVHLNRLPLPSGSLELYRIDREHASYADNPRSEDLAVLERTRFRGSRASWSGTIPALGLIFLRLHDASRESLLGPARIGTFVRSHYGFPDRRKDAYADFDPRTSIARLGMGGSATAVAQIGNVMDDVERRLLVRVKRAGPFQALDVNSAFGLRIDFRSASGKYTKSVIFHGGLYDPRRTSALPWGKGGQADRAIQRAEMNGGQPFRIDLGELAPPDWDRHRVLITFLLQNAGKGSRTRIALTKAALR